MHVLSGLFEEETPSQALSDAGNRARPSRAAFDGADRTRGKSAGASAGDSGLVPNASNATSPTWARRPGAGPSARWQSRGPSPSAEELHEGSVLRQRRNFPWITKTPTPPTYRDRINNELAYWFGECFAPGRAVVECNAPKILAAVVYLATRGRVPSYHRARSGTIMRKRLQAKNANYTM